jgi:methylglutaconyl-CoA hydratase
VDEVKARDMKEEEEKPVATEIVQKQKSPAPAKPAKKTNKRKTSTKKQSANSPAQKKQSAKKAKATLYGLASLKRVGNVKVTPSADYTTVKSNFVLGPLMLKVEKEQEEKRDIKMATATTHEIYGRINIRVVNGQASLHSIKVQQPKQVKVDSEDNQISTRQYSWNKNSNLARVVSKQLRSVAKALSMPSLKNLI